MIRDVLVSFGATRELAEKIQAICLGVSFNSEIKDLGHVRELIVRYPELAVVQDADRLGEWMSLNFCSFLNGAPDTWNPLEKKHNSRATLSSLHKLEGCKSFAWLKLSQTQSAP